MKKIFLFAVCLTIIFLTCTILQAQTNNWIRVSSDDGEFSIEVPAKYDFFFDKDGYWTAKGPEDFQLKNMNMLNAFADGALLSFESYEAKKGALEGIYEHDKRVRQNIRLSFSEIKTNGKTIKQIIEKTEKTYCFRWYFHSKSRIYILTAASEDKENQVVKRFLDSLSFKPETLEKLDSNSTLFSSLKITPVSLSQLTPDEAAAFAVSPTKASGGQIIVVRKPNAVYTDSARMKGIQGTIQIRAAFNENGFIPKIEIIKALPNGLLRQTIFAVLTMKFLPQTETSKFATATKVVEYKFAIY